MKHSINRTDNDKQERHVTEQPVKMVSRWDCSRIVLVFAQTFTNLEEALMRCPLFGPVQCTA